MTDRRGARWALIAAGVLCAIVVAVLIVAPPYVVRDVLRDYLHSHGIQARIDNVDANIFTGRISVDDVRGHGPHGDAFRIGHLAVDIDYGPLFHKRIEFERMALSDARIPVRRRPEQGLTVLGIPLVSGSSGQHSQSSGWGFGVGDAKMGNIVFHYHGSGRDDRPAVDQRMTLAQAGIGRFATWQPARATPVTLGLTIDDGRLNLDGRMSLLAPKRTAHFKLDARRFPMAAVAPLARMAGWHELGGTVDADQTLDFQYDTEHGLALGLDGDSTWRHAQTVTRDSTRLGGRRLAWHGQAKIRLRQGSDQPGDVNAQGRLTLASIRVRRPKQLDFTQNSAHWQGKAKVELGADTTRVTTRGDLSARQTRLNTPGWLSLSSARESLHGGLDLTFGAQRTTIDSDGRFKARSMSLSIPETVSFDTDTLDWHGKTTIALAGDGTHIDTQGSLAGKQLVFNVPGTTHVRADHIDWQGSTRMLSAALFSRAIEGHLIARNPRVEIPGLPTRMTADRLSFDGRYAAQPEAGKNQLRLTVTGSAASRNLAVLDTAIDAPWLDAMQIQADGIAIDSLDSIKLGQIRASGLRMLGDTDTDSAVLQAVSLTADRFSLADRAHYALHGLAIDDADIHIRRDASGMGVISEFMHSAGRAPHPDQSKPEGHSNGHAPTRATFAVDHLHLSGPAIAFVDTTPTPSVHISGHDLDFKIDDLDTAQPDQSASYRLSLDIGAYGHFDSRGRIAPLAPGGPDMDLDAWLRSLALAPFSGYLDAAMGRKIANGAADGTLNLAATNGELDGVLDTSIANFRLANSAKKKTEIAFGISMNSALKLLRGHDDLLNFKTKILGDVTNPYFSINNLIREAVLAGLRTALLSNYSPVGLLNNAKNSFLNLFRSVEDRPAIFRPGKHYVRPADRKYLALIAQAMHSHPAWTLHISGRAVPADAKPLNLADTPAAERRARLVELARQRQQAIRDYLAARNVNPARIVGGEPSVATDPKARPTVAFSLDKQ